MKSSISLVEEGQLRLDEPVDLTNHDLGGQDRDLP